MIWIEAYILENGTQVYSSENDGTTQYATAGYELLDQYLASLETPEPEAE